MKRAVSLFIFCVMIFGFTVQNFMLSEWASEETARAVSLQIAEEGQFDGKWQENVTRENFCKLAYNSMLSGGANFSLEISKSFSDTDDENIYVLYSLGILNGKTASGNEIIFAPQDAVTREEAAAIIYRIAAMLNMYLTNDEMNETEIFADHEEISEWAKTSVYHIRGLGLLNGKSDNKFCPKDNMTNEEAAVIFVRLYDEIKRKYGEKGFEDKLFAEMPNDNFMISPLSVKMLLALLANGATGETKNEILNAAEIENLDDFNEKAKVLIKNFSESEILKLNISNSVWINEDNTQQRFTKAYEELVSEFYDAKSDVAGKNDAVSKINSWVSEKTNGKITEVTNSADFWAALINVIYFKARWQNEFSPHLTAKREFTSIDGSKAEIDFLNKRSYFKYADNGRVKIAELPYLNFEPEQDENGEMTGYKRLENIDVSMFVLMSEKSFDPIAELNGAELKSTYLDFSMPKFKIEFNVDLKRPLNALGITRAFDKNAEFSEMLDANTPLWVTDVFHKTFIEVDEKGTEAAAVTLGGMGGTSLPPEPVSFILDKPFCFVIKDNISGEILFMGSMAAA